MIKEFRGDYRFLSNFWYVSIEFEGHTYRTTEHAFQAAKTLDSKERTSIREAKTPGEAKRLGRKVTLRSDWEDIKLDIMYQLNKKKFSQLHLRDQLMATEGHELQEGNWWSDEFWGVNNKTGEGKNHLGKILIRIRDELRDGRQHADDLLRRR